MVKKCVIVCIFCDCFVPSESSRIYSAVKLIKELHVREVCYLYITLSNSKHICHSLLVALIIHLSVQYNVLQVAQCAASLLVVDSPGS